MEISFLKPPFDDEEIAAVTQVLRTTNLSTGPEVNQFEQEFANFIGTKHAIAVNSGTSALELTLQALILSGRIDNGAGVIVPSFTFVAVANAVVNAGLYPVFADISATTMNIDTENMHISTPTKIQAIIPVHTFGMPCDLYEITKFAGKHGLIVIEDCAEALGSSYERKQVGSRTDYGIFSFTPTKNMTTGEGGMITTNSAEIAEIIRTFREHGITGQTRNAVVPGHNYRMANILAAIGLVQLEKLNRFNAERNRNAITLSELIDARNLPVFVTEASICRTHQMYVIQLINTAGVSATSEERDKVVTELHKRGVDAKVYFDPPIHKQAYYEHNDLRCSTTGMEVTEVVSERVISLPMYPDLSYEELEYMADSLADSIKAVV